MRAPLLLLLLLGSFCFAQLDFKDDENERMKYGLSQAEWQKYKESGISKSKFESLIRCGISINEYISRPWMTVGVSEDQWLSERCQGLGDEDIQAFHEKGETDVSTIISFVLPGFYHWKSKSYGKAALFSCAFASSIALYFAVRDEEYPRSTGANNQTIVDTVSVSYPVFLLIGVTDMVASAVFAYRDGRKSVQEQKDADQEQSSLPLRLYYKPEGAVVGLIYARSF